MIDPDALNVWCEAKLVGYLWRNAVGYIGFRYESEWIANEGFAISQQLPLREEPFSEDDWVAHLFFANLLPEGHARERFVRDRKVPNTDFELLREIGGECAGALSILPVEQDPSNNYSYRLLTGKELVNLVARRGQVTIAVPEEDKPRLSLAGAQDKCPILLQDGNLFLPLRESPSSHILKFEIPGYKNVPAYETFTTYLAKYIGLPTVDINLCTSEKNYYLLIERYDRVLDEENKIHRFHQEDFCQALGLGHEKKYQEHGGPTFAQCFTLVQNVSSDPAVDAEYLLRWQIFNVLAGNSDGHAKNLSFIYYPRGEVRLAPFYDLVSTRAIKYIDSNLAFSVGGERNPGRVMQTQWNTLANDCDVGQKYLNGLVKEIGENLLENMKSAREQFEQQYGENAALQRIEGIVTQQCHRSLNV